MIMAVPFTYGGYVPDRQRRSLSRNHRLLNFMMAQDIPDKYLLINRLDIATCGRLRQLRYAKTNSSFLTPLYDSILNLFLVPDSSTFLSEHSPIRTRIH
jgi:hypothetical protein